VDNAGQQQKDVNGMDLDGAIAEFVESRNIPIFGIANTPGFADALPGWHPKELMPKCESVIVFGHPLVQHPLHMEKRTYIANQSWWDAQRTVDRQIITWKGELFGLLDGCGLGVASFGVFRPTTLPTFSYRLAQVEAGVGVYGRAGACIHPDYGSYYRVGVLLTQAVLGEALASTQPLQTFLVTLDQVGGYKEDSVRKKSLLLAMILNDRPETFLPLRDDEHITPIIDYHFMRSCLRIGLIDVLDGELETKLTNRQIVSPAEEWAVRYPAYLALEGVVLLSGKSLGAVNSFLFTNARKRCPEMTEPQCRLCSLDPVCAHRKELFQPVLRTSFY
jgi:hypothetical protein